MWSGLDDLSFGLEGYLCFMFTASMSLPDFKVNFPYDLHLTTLKAKLRGEPSGESDFLDVASKFKSLEKFFSILKGSIDEL